MYARIVGAPLCAHQVLACGHLLLMRFAEIADGPTFEGLRDVNVPQRSIDLLFKGLSLNRGLSTAYAMQPLRAVVIDVVVHIAVLLPFDLPLGGNHRATFPTADESGEGECMALWPWLPFTSQQELHVVKFLKSHQGFVAALAELVSELEQPGIERVREHFIDRAARQRFVTTLPCRTSSKTPVVGSDLQNPRWGIAAGEHQIPHSTDKRKALWVCNDDVISVCCFGVQISHRWHAGEPPAFSFGFEAPFDVLGKIVDVLLRHAKLDVHENGVLILLAERIGGGDDGDVLLTDGPDDCRSINGVSGKAVEFPADDALCFTPVEPLHHSVEHRPSGGFGRAGLGEDLDDGEVLAFGQLLQLGDLGVNRKHLAVFRLGGFAAIEKIALLHTGSLP